MRSPRFLLCSLWNLRSSPNRMVRAAWWGCFLALVILGAFSQSLSDITLIIGVVLNAFFLLIAVGWGFGHPRAVLPASNLARRWASWLTVIFALLAWANVANTAVQTQALEGVIGVALPLVLVVSLVAFLLFLGFGLVGASISAFAGRSKPQPRQSATGVNGFWIAALLLALPGLFLPARFQTLPIWTPLLAAWITLVIQHSGDRPARAFRRVLRSLERGLVWKPGLRSRPVTLDFRGAALGLLAAAMIQALAAANLFVLLQMWGLSCLIQFHNALIQALSVSAAGPIFPVLPRDQIVLLNMDVPTIHQILVENRSESLVQARMIRNLASWGATRIVLPPPLLETPQDWTLRSRRNAPPPTPADIRRTLRDLPGLEAAIRSAGNVVLACSSGVLSNVAEGPPGTAIPSADLARSCPQVLRRAALSAGSADLEYYRSAAFPAIPTTLLRGKSTRAPGALLPVPILLFAALQRHHPLLQPVPGHPELVEVAGRRFQQAPPGEILIDYESLHPGRDFQYADYSNVLSGDAIWAAPVPPSKGQGRWLSPSQYFKGKIVFLDSLARQTQQTPLGQLSQMEVLAYATDSLVHQTLIRQPFPSRTLLLIFLVGIVVGCLCNRQPPLQSGWRSVLVVFPVIGFSVAAFVSDRTWIDPVAPTLAAVAAFLFVTQLTFGLERGERERNRSLLRRFVAPQVVEELLEDPQASLGLGGTRQKVCILFADVRNFTPFAEQHSPEEVIEVTNTYLTAMTEALFQHGGILDKYTGDGLMAIFRLSNSNGDIETAARAALAIRDAALAVSKRRIEEGREPLDVGIGLHSGDAVVGLVGNPDQFNYTALGHTVIVSQRLQSIAAGGEIVISETVHIATSGIFHVDEGEPVLIKGISEPVRPYRIRSLREHPSLPSPSSSQS